MEKNKAGFSPWNTGDEIKSIKYIASDTPRIGSKFNPTLAERKAKLKVYLETAKIRVWLKTVNREECIDLAKSLYSDMVQMTGEKK